MDAVGTVTFLFTDIEGSTQLVRTLGDVYANVLADHHRVLRETAKRYDGEEVDTQGDAFFFTFRRARDAILAAAEAQRALTAHAWPDDAQVRVRMGIHTGEPGRSVTGYHGLGVVRAARISAAGHGGQVLVSQATRSLVEDEELPGIAFEDLGEHGLKDLERPERLFQLTIEGLPHEFPPPRGVESQTVKEEFVEPKRRLDRRRLGVVALGVVALAAVLAFVLTRGGSVTVVANSLATIDPKTNRVVHDVAVGTRPLGLVATDNGVWVADSGDQALVHVSPAGKVVRTIGIGGAATDVALGSGSLWVVTGNDNTLVEVNPNYDSVVQTVRLAGRNASFAAFAVTTGFGSVWASSSGHVLRFDPPKNRIVQRIGVGFPAGLTVGGGRVWDADGSEEIIAISPVRTTRPTNIHLGSSPLDIAYGAGSVWVSAQRYGPARHGDVWRIDPQTNQVVATIAVGFGPNALTVGAGAVWVANQDGTVSRIDPASDRVVATIKVGQQPSGIAYGAGRIWVTVD